MFYSLTGELVHTDATTAAVSCGGIAFQCRVSTQTLNRLGPVGTEATLYTFLNVKQDGVDLFGFYDQDELAAFKMLKTIKGVGPTNAMSFLSELTPSEIFLAIASDDYKTLSRAKGIGQTVAKRVADELKSRVTKQLAGKPGADVTIAAAATGNTNLAEAVSALVMLGYSQSEASTAAGKCDPSQNVEQIIKQALKNLS